MADQKPAQNKQSIRIGDKDQRKKKRYYAGNKTNDKVIQKRFAAFAMIIKFLWCSVGVGVGGVGGVGPPPVGGSYVQLLRR